MSNPHIQSFIVLVKLKGAVVFSATVRSKNHASAIVNVLTNIYKGELDGAEAYGVDEQTPTEVKGATKPMNQYTQDLIELKRKEIKVAEDKIIGIDQQIETLQKRRIAQQSLIANVNLEIQSIQQGSETTA